MIPLDELPTIASTWPKQAPVGYGVQIHEDVRVGPRRCKRLCPRNQRHAPGVRVRIDKQELPGGLQERGKQRIGLGIRVPQNRYRDAMPRAPRAA